MAQATRFEPPASEIAGPFWDATKEEKLLLQWCRDCSQPVFYPREVCPTCLKSAGLEWRPASGKGVVYAVSVQHTPQMPMPFYQNGPYAVALVELEEGVRMLTNVIGCPPESVTVGQPVQVTWEALSDGRNLPLFEPAS